MADTLTAEQRERRHRAFLEAWGVQLAKDARHPRSLWTHEHQVALEVMQAWHPLHAPTYPAGVVGPPPLHTLTEAAETARAAMRAAGQNRRIPADLPIETHVLPPWRVITVDQAPSAAASFWRAAGAAGLEVVGRMAGDRAVQVGVARRVGGEHYRPVLWMRATWSRTESGSLTSKGVLITDPLSLVGVTAAKALWAVQSET